MNRRKPMTSRQLAREKLVFRYSSALERGDFEIISAVLREAENDPVLERMLHEINDVYRAELAPPPALPSFSANHNHRTAREDATMSVTYPSIRRVALPAASRGRWSSTATLAAAIIAIILFAAVLIARRPPSQEQQGSVLQNETVTATLVAEVCRVFNPDDNVLLQSDISGGIVTGTLPKGIVADVLGHLTDSQSGHIWYHVSVQVSDTTFTGWVRDDQVTPLNTCPSGRPTPTPDVQQATSTWTPTLVPQQPVVITATPVQDVGIVFATPPDVPVLCQGIVSSNTAVDGVNVFVDADSNSIFMGRIPVGTAVDILDSRDFSTGGWYYVRSDTSWGWMSAEFVLLTAPCTYPGGQPWTSYPCGTNFAIAPTPTFIPEQNVPTEEPVLLTATAYAATAFAPAVSPCSSGAQPTPTAFVPYPTPTAVFDLALRSGGYDLVTTEQIGDIPANTRVRINSAQFDGTQWLYDVIAKDGQTRGLAYDYQMAYVPGVTPGAATPTAMFGFSIGTGFYSAVTTQPIGDIPAGTLVHVSSAWYNGTEWIYQIQDASGLTADNARESQLAVAPGYEAGMPTPTALFFGNGNLVTLEQVGTIPAGTLVQTTSGYFDGTGWVYTVATLDSSLYAEARDSQLRYATASDYGPGPTPPPTETATPTLVQ